ncbi:MAG: hypothetical protein QOD14_1212 [Solirubrobacterales bacterium]|jgi:hypothetical protein|nr:hypothetical protein [Solirubrobacterales bacterium]
MKRIALLISLIAVLAGLVAVPSALGIKAGFNLATQRLEAAYKIALFERRFSEDGCYPAPPQLAQAIHQSSHRKVGVAPNTRSLAHVNQVYVLKQGTNCEHLRMALRAAGGTYVLDSKLGTVRLQGHRGAATPGLAKPLTNLTLATKTFHVTKPDTAPRLETLCPGGRFPVGGGMSISPPTGADGEGIYPHSYERLGAQRGWHISVVFLDPSRASTTARDVTVQALCGFGVIPATPTPHRTVYLRPGETKTVTARCPSGQYLVSGGFQRTDFRSDGGDYVTESHAAGPKAWTVSGHAYGTGSGELTAIAYCVRMKRPILTEVASSPAPVAASSSVTTTTPTCPAGKRLITGGFSMNGSTNALFAAGRFNPDGTWSANGYGFFGAAPQLTAYGYCLPARS